MTGSTDRLFVSVPRDRRSPLGAAASVVLHAAAAVAGLWVADVGAFEPARPPTASITYLLASSALPEVALLRERPATTAREPVASPRPAVLPEPEERFTPSPVNAVGRDSAVAARDEAAPLPVAAVPEPSVEPARPAPPVARPVSVGTFDITAAAHPRGAAAGVVHPLELQATPALTASPAPRLDAVRSTEFDQKAAPRPAVTVAAQETPDVPVEIVFKPTPDYTDQARALRVQGDVIVEVEFSAAGEVRVVRVVRGLGHGLDESAARAAARIRFRPARRAGRPVDVRTIVRIVFRLA
jgi:TonB family protein